MRLARALCALVILANACSNGDRGDEASGLPGPISVERAGAVLQALCDLEAIGTPSDEAASAFFGDAHDVLHDVAAATETDHRELTARLLEAKAAVEAPLEGGEEPGSFAQAVRDLRARTEEALDVLDLAVADPCRR